MTAKQLLRSRYKVMMDYPGSNLPVGYVIHLSTSVDIHGRYNYYCDANANFWMLEEDIKKYPHVFKLLRWYEDREQSDMPAYVKHNSALSCNYWEFNMCKDKVSQVFTRLLPYECLRAEHWYGTTHLPIFKHYNFDMHAHQFIPIDFEEYDNYINCRNY